MEKLQMALQRARSQRGDDTLTEVSRRRLPAPGKLATDQLWSDLPAFSPDPKTLRNNRIMTLNASKEARPFDLLRTKTLLHMRKNGWRRLAITSATAGCGKTVVACNLILGLARQPELRALLIELDLRRPSIATLLGAKPAHDVSDVLAGTVPFDQQALRLGQNVAVSMATHSSADPIRFLLSPTTGETLTRIEALYKPDLVIFDLPPLLAGGDTSAFLGEVDCALAVARAASSTVAQIDECEREIAEHTNVLGVVLNQCRYRDETAGARDYDY